jgi:hypothetical protein
MLTQGACDAKRGVGTRVATVEWEIPEVASSWTVNPFVMVSGFKPIISKKEVVVSSAKYIVCL